MGLNSVHNVISTVSLSADSISYSVTRVPVIILTCKRNSFQRQEFGVSVLSAVLWAPPVDDMDLRSKNIDFLVYSTVLVQYE